MRPAVELAVLLIFLCLGYTAAKGSARPMRDFLSGLRWWVVTFAILAVLVTQPDLFAWVVRIGGVLAIAYASYLTARWAWQHQLGLPDVPRIRRRQITLVCREFEPQSRAAACEAARVAMTTCSSGAVLSALATACARRIAPDQIGRFVSDECSRTVKATEEIVPALRTITGRSRRQDARIVEYALLTCGRGAVEKSLKLLDRAKGSREQFLRIARESAADPEKRLLLTSVGVDAPEVVRGGTSRDLWYLWTLALIHPLWPIFYFSDMHGAALAWLACTGLLGFAVCLGAYAQRGLVARAATFGISCATMAGYGTYLLFVVKPAASAGWVFLAVFGLLNMTGLFNMGLLTAKKGT